MSAGTPESFAENPLVDLVQQDAIEEFEDQDALFGGGGIAPCALVALPAELPLLPLSVEQAAAAADAVKAIADYPEDFVPTPEKLKQLHDTLVVALPPQCAQLAALGIALNMGAPDTCFFPHVSPLMVARQTMLRIMNPGRVDQGWVGSCGPAAFAIQLLRFDPVGYATCVSSLLATGRGQIGTLDLKPHSDIKAHTLQSRVEYSDGKKGIEQIMPEADWVFLASLRNHVSFSLLKMKRVLQPKLSMLGDSPLHLMYKWSTKAGYPGAIAVDLNDGGPVGAGLNISYHPSAKTLGKPDFGWGKRDALDRAMDMMKDGWLVILQGDANIAYAAEEAQDGTLAEAEKSLETNRRAGHYMVLEELAYVPGSKKQSLRYSVTNWTKTHTYETSDTSDFLKLTKGILLLRGHEHVDHALL